MISVITPVLDRLDEPDKVRETMAALALQTVGEIEHLLVGPHVDAIAPTIQAGRPDGLSVTLVTPTDDDWLGSGLVAAEADLVVVLFPGESCVPDALAQLAARFDEPLPAGTPKIAMVYADHRLPLAPEPSVDLDDPSASLTAVADHPAPVALKPAPSPEYLRGKNYVANAAMFDRRELAEGPFSADPVTAIHDLALRGMEAHGSQLAAVLFELSGPAAHLAPSQAAVEAHLKRMSLPATVVVADDAASMPATTPVSLRVLYSISDDPLVSVIIPTRGSVGREWGATRAYLVDAIGSISARSTYPHIEFVVVYDTDTPPAVLAGVHRVAGQPVRTIEYTRPFNFSDKINVGVASSRGELLLLLNDDTELIEPRSVAEMVGLATQADVGTVGARLLYSDTTLQHGGHVYSGEMLHACEGWPGDSAGPLPLTPLAVARETTGVTAAAAMVRRSVFDEVGGFSPEFPVNFNDVDFCLKLVDAGYRNLWTPAAVWFHFESVSRGRSYDDVEVDRIFDRWGPRLQHDPYYNQNLIPKRADWLEQPGLADW